MPKRKHSVSFADDVDDVSATSQRKPTDGSVKKNSLDSDEEDEAAFDDDNILDENDIEGEEDGEARQDGEIRMTAFNMKEELEEGHFDKDGHFHWDREKEIKDSWLDNIDWHKIKEDPERLKKIRQEEEEDDEGDEASSKFDVKEAYKQVLEYLKPKETISKALRRLGGNRKMSSVERLKLKKSGQLNNNEPVEKLTEIANSILKNTGNMDVYQESFEQISAKLSQSTSKGKTAVKEPVLDMYADDFDEKEHIKLQEEPSTSSQPSKETLEPKLDSMMWEFKWKQDAEEIHGPCSSEQMQQWVDDGYFSGGVWVRKHGHEDTKFYSSNRIDFELYIS